MKPRFFIFVFCVLFVSVYKSAEQEQELDFQDVIKHVRLSTETLSNILWDAGESVTRKPRVTRHFKDTQVYRESGHSILDEIAINLKQMMSGKARAVRYIQKRAEQLIFRKSRSGMNGYEFNNANNLDNLPVSYDKQFKLSVNTTHSAIKFAPNVLESDERILNDLKWSENLDSTFRENHQNDPTLSWQYFASAKGFMRFFPATKWKEMSLGDSYDFRTMSWFTEAIASPKDVIILLDNSKVMKKSSRILAKEVVHNILDTLSANDFVNVYSYSNETKPLEECFNYSLVQASEGNLRLLREKLNGLQKEQAEGNVTQPFQKAFEQLGITRSRGNYYADVHCNQIIILISQGETARNVEKQFFTQYNMPEEYYRPVRVFTYQLGKDLENAKMMEWLACANMGFYVNVSSSVEAQRATFKYLEVLSRPLNLNDNQEVWTGLYAHLVDKTVPDSLWKKVEDRLENRVNFDEVEFRNGDRKFDYMISLSMPVHDKRKDAYELLGVVGVDISREFINSLIDYNKLGVNGYAFIVTNNGHLILHPDHRTEFMNIPKPTFNFVDITEVELDEHDNKPREFSMSMMILRRNLIEHRNGTHDLHVRSHLDNMKRVVLSHRHYLFTPLGHFTLGIALPDNYGFLKFRHNGEEGLYQQALSDLLNFKRSRSRRFWKIHPEWHYCDYGSQKTFKTPEDELLYIIQNSPQSLRRHCDLRLLMSLLADYQVTKWFDDPLHSSANNSMTKLTEYFPISTVFLATSTGLTRWQDIESLPYDDNHFSNKHSRTIDEVFYKRAAQVRSVDHSFIYSVPFPNEITNDSTVTAASTVFIKETPVATVGYQMKYNSFQGLISNVANDPKTQVRCDRDRLDCFILDNNGYVIVGFNKTTPGTFFGKIRPDIMEKLIGDDIYRKIKFFDYQAVCYNPYTGSLGNRFLSILQNLFEMVHYMIATILYMAQATMGKTVTTPETQTPPKLVPTACDKEMWLYEFGSKIQSSKDKPRNSWYYVAKRIEKSNLLFLAVNGFSILDKNVKLELYDTTPQKIDYNMSLPCYTVSKYKPGRKNRPKCFKKSPAEKGLNSNKKFCGGEGSL